MNAHQRRKERRAFRRELEAAGVRFSQWAGLRELRRLHNAPRPRR